MLSLGTFPKVSLAAARERRDAARQQVAACRDPSDTRKAEKATRRRALGKQALLAAGKPLPGASELMAREWLTNVHEATVSAGHASGGGSARCPAAGAHAPPRGDRRAAAGRAGLISTRR